MKIASVNPYYDTSCPRCRVEETLIHTLKDYPKARAVLAYGGLDGHILDYATTTAVDWLEYSLNFLDKNAFEDFIVVLWNI